MERLLPTGAAGRIGSVLRAVEKIVQELETVELHMRQMSGGGT